MHACLRVKPTARTVVRLSRPQLCRQFLLPPNLNGNAGVDIREGIAHHSPKLPLPYESVLRATFSLVSGPFPGHSPPFSPRKAALTPSGNAGTQTAEKGVLACAHARGSGSRRRRTLLKTSFLSPEGGRLPDVSLQSPRSEILNIVGKAKAGGGIDRHT